MRTTQIAAAVVALFISVASQSPAADLTITRSGGAVLLRWPQGTTNDFYLQFTTNLAPPFTWGNANDPITNGTNLMVTDNGAASSRFYRLKAWEILFDGTSTAAFRGYQQTTFPPASSWAVTANGELQTVVGGAQLNIITTNQYSDFDLVWEWKAGTNGNSGVNYRCTEEYSNSEWSGPEYQLLDDVHYTVGAANKIGAVWNLIAPTNKVTVPTGQWNQCRLIVQGNYVEHWLNGRKVVAYYMNSASFQNLVAANPMFKLYPNFAKASSGYIAFRHENTPMWYRNIKIRQLPAQ
ncbi:MAG: hypothetical protein JWR69_3597 [Pedosphaera sp.]|nr:hypothetical protein [Pedosphaera sp.]